MYKWIESGKNNGAKNRGGTDSKSPIIAKCYSFIFWQNIKIIITFNLLLKLITFRMASLSSSLSFPAATAAAAEPYQWYHRITIKSELLLLLFAISLLFHDDSPKYGSAMPGIRRRRRHYRTTTIRLLSDPNISTRFIHSFSHSFC